MGKNMNEKNLKENKSEKMNNTTKNQNTNFSKNPKVAEIEKKIKNGGNGESVSVNKNMVNGNKKNKNKNRNFSNKPSGRPNEFNKNDKNKVNNGKTISNKSNDKIKNNTNLNSNINKENENSNNKVVTNNVVSKEKLNNGNTTNNVNTTNNGNNKNNANLKNSKRKIQKKKNGVKGTNTKDKGNNLNNTKNAENKVNNTVKKDESKIVKNVANKKAVESKIENKKEELALVKKENVKVKDEVKDENKKEKKVSVLLLIIIILTLTIVILISIFFVSFFSNKISNNVSINGINVSRMTKDEAKNKILDEYKDVLGNEIKCSYKEDVYTISLESIGFDLKVDDAINEAMSLGKEENLTTAIKNCYLLKFGNSKDIDLSFTYNKENLKNKIQEIEGNFLTEVQQYSYKVENDVLTIVNGKDGISVDYDEFEKQINDNIDNKDISKTVNIPIKVTEYDPIDVEKIYGEVHVDMSNASYVEEPEFQLHQEVVGVSFNKDELKKVISENPLQETYTSNIEYTQPEVRVGDLDLYNDVLGRFSTWYVNNPNRTTNLRLAANKVNGMIMMPGDEFSYNNVVGERTVAAGYKNAAIFVNGEVTDGLAGGICQISSTIYDAVVFADLEVTERFNHARVPSYVGAGKDATVYWGSKDFKFKNNKKTPIKILVTVENGQAVCTIMGKKTGEEFDISLETYNAGSSGGYMITSTYKIYKKDGVVVKKEHLYNDSYKVG